MANLSSAFGTVTIKADKKEYLEELIQLQEISDEGAYYNTTLSDPMYYKDDDGSFAVSCDVMGTGRWTFIRNIEWFFDNLFDDTYTDPNAQERINQLRTHPFTAEFTITDEELGVYFILEILQTIEWHPESKSQKTVTQHIQEYRPTAHLMETMCEYDAWQYVDADYLLMHWDEFINILTDSITNESDSKDVIECYARIIDNQPLVRDYLEKIRDKDYIQDNIYELFEYAPIPEDSDKNIMELLQLTTSKK